MKKSKIIELLLAKDRLTFNRIAKIVNCEPSYVARLNMYIGKAKKRPILDFRGLLRKL